MQEQQDQRNTEIKGVTSREPEKTFEQMMITNLDIVSDLPSSDQKRDTDDQDDDDSELGMLSQHDEPGRLTGAISRMVQQCIERFRQNLEILDELRQLGWCDATDYLP